MPVLDHTVEHIPAWNGKKEDKYVFSFLLAVFVIAALLMQWLYPKDKVVVEKIPQDIRQQLTALSNAAEEILLLTEMTGQAPSLLELQEMAVPPFAKVPLNTMTQVHWSEPGPCFIGYGQLNEPADTTSKRFFQLLLSFESRLSVQTTSAHTHEAPTLFFIHWRLMDAESTEQAQSQTDTLNCQQALNLSDWQTPH